MPMYAIFIVILVCGSNFVSRQTKTAEKIKDLKALYSFIFKNSIVLKVTVLFCLRLIAWFKMYQEVWRQIVSFRNKMPLEIMALNAFALYRMRVLVAMFKSLSYEYRDPVSTIRTEDVPDWFCYKKYNINLLSICSLLPYIRENKKNNVNQCNLFLNFNWFLTWTLFNPFLEIYWIN